MGPSICPRKEQRLTVPIGDQHHTLGPRCAAAGRSRELPGVRALSLGLMGERLCPRVSFNQDRIPGDSNSAWNLTGAPYGLTHIASRDHVSDERLSLPSFPRRHLAAGGPAHGPLSPWAVSTCQVLLREDTLCPRLQHPFSAPAPSRPTPHSCCPHRILHMGLLVLRPPPREGTWP